MLGGQVGALARGLLSLLFLIFLLLLVFAALFHLLEIRCLVQSYSSGWGLAVMMDTRGVPGRGSVIRFAVLVWRIGRRQMIPTLPGVFPVRRARHWNARLLLDRAGGHAVASELEAQQPHSCSSILSWNELPLPSGVLGEAGEISARPGIFHECANDVAGGLDQYPHRHVEAAFDLLANGLRNIRCYLVDDG